MLILLRLAEDVIFFQTLPAQRRRDIQQKLTQNMDSIFSFMMTILRMNVEELRKLVSEHSSCIPTTHLPISQETKNQPRSTLDHSLLQSFSRNRYLVTNSRWEINLCISALDSAASTFCCFQSALLLVYFWPTDQKFLPSRRVHAEHPCRLLRLGVAFLSQL